MKVLITGITGNVGSHLADYILNNHQNVELHGIARWRSPLDNIEKIKHKINSEDAIYLTLDNIKKTPEGKCLDELGLTKMCCRRHMLTHVDLE